jgi:hypothetical protein
MAGVPAANSGARKRFSRSASTWPLVAAVMLAGSACSVATSGAERGEVARAAMPVAPPAQAVSDQPLTFELNVGQSDPQVRFLARRPGVDVFLTERDAVVALTPSAGTGAAAVRLVPFGGDPAAHAVGLDPQPGRINYLVGPDPDRWHTGAATFAKVAQRGVYPGIDLVYYGNGGQLEYDVVVAPGADPGAVRLGVEGARGLRLEGNGDLVIDTAAGPLTQRRPVAYQDIAGARVPVAAAYVLVAGDEVGVRLGTYDPSVVLVIDPVLSYSTYLGGTGFDSVQHVAVDSAGAVYVTGFSLSTTTFPATVGDTTFGGSRDAFVAKFSSAGALQWSTYLGGSGSETGFAIAVDAAGAAHIGGNTTSSDFPATVNDTTYNSSVNFTTDAFAAKLAPDGTSLTWATYLGGNQLEQVNTAAIALGAAGSVIVGGETQSANYPTTTGVFQPTMLSAQEAFVTKLSSTGTTDWSTYLGGATGIQSESAYGVAVDATGVYVAGSTRSPDFPTTVGAFDTTYGGGTSIADAFVTKFNLTGTALIYSTFLGGTGSDQGQAIAVDSAGAAYVAGSAPTGFPTTAGAFDTTNNGGDDGYVAKLNPAGSALVYSTYVGGTGPDSFTTIAVDAAGTAFVTGSTNSTDFPLTPDALDTVQAGGDAPVTRVSANGSTLLYSSLLGGAASETGRGPALGPAGVAWFVGQTGSTDHPTTTGAFDETNNGGTDGFVTKFTFPLASTHISLPGTVTLSTGWNLRNSLTTGAATSTFTLGTKPLVPIAGDWDGNGSKTPGSFEAGTFRLSNSIVSPAVDATFTFGDTRGFPVVGDWNGDGTDDVAVVRAGVWQTRLSTGATGSFSFGPATNWPNVVPVAGDWNCDGTDGIGTYNLMAAAGTVGQWNLRQTASAGAADAGTFLYNPGTSPYPVVGDWNADGTSSVGVKTGTTPAVWNLNNANDASAADITFSFGSANDLPVVWGD